jgi:cytochrome c oxidase assembly protein subunit 15
MVMSGLVDRVDVTQYRLAAHLSLAVLIMGAIFWVALGLGPAPLRSAYRPSRAVALSAAGLIAAVFLQIALGGLVAGLDAGQGYNTWPLMEGSFIPSGLGAMEPWYRNVFENALTVQFQHRMLAYVVGFWALAQGAAIATAARRGAARDSGLVLAILVLLQISLGITTLLAHAPIDLSLAHQAGAMIVFLAAIYHLHAVRAARGSIRDHTFARA